MLEKIRRKKLIPLHSSAVLHCHQRHKNQNVQYFRQFTEMFLKKSKAVLHWSQMDTDTDVPK
jgi:hypothetical protein